MWELSVHTGHSGAHSKTDKRGIGTTNFAPQSRTKFMDVLISSFKFHGRMKM